MRHGTKGDARRLVAGRPTAEPGLVARSGLESRRSRSHVLEPDGCPPIVLCTNDIGGPCTRRAWDSASRAALVPRAVRSAPLHPRPPRGGVLGAPPRRAAGGRRRGARGTGASCGPLRAHSSPPSDRADARCESAPSGGRGTRRTARSSPFFLPNPACSMCTNLAGPRSSARQNPARGGRGIRTHEAGATDLAVFKTAALGHYASPPTLSLDSLTRVPAGRMGRRRRGIPVANSVSAGDQ